jgi:hypothetical protein
MALRFYRLLWVSAAVMISSLAAIIFVKGGWQAVVIAIALMAGFAVLTAVIALRLLAEEPEPAPAPLRRPGTASGHGLERAEGPKAATEDVAPDSALRDEPAFAARPRPRGADARRRAAAFRRERVRSQ